jgi:hypothetical protein
MVVAVKPKSTNDLDMYVSIDGRNFANAQFPLGSGLAGEDVKKIKDFILTILQSYTVLQSTRASLVVDINPGKNAGREYGTILTSNSNGTYFVKSLAYTNRNVRGNVDYERVQNVEGIMLANIVSNPDELSMPSADKKIESRISFNEGSKWHFLKPPEKNLDGKAFSCASEGTVPNEKCALHLHSITSPSNVGYIFSTPGAPGVLMGVGNVGDYLLSKEQCDTFISVDGGINWAVAQRGPHQYEFGDMGGVIVMIKDIDVTDNILFVF